MAQSVVPRSATLEEYLSMGDVMHDARCYDAADQGILMQLCRETRASDVAHVCTAVD